MKFSNQCWMFHPDLKSFSAEISELEHCGPLKDPWDKPIQLHNFQRHTHDGDVTHWTLSVVIAGDSVYQLTIYND